MRRMNFLVIRILEQKMNKHNEQINLLSELLADAIENCLDVDREKTNEKWDGYIQGIEASIYRLEINSV